MDNKCRIITSISIIIIICISIYLLTRKKTNIENFTALSGFNPLTTYDDFGTFNYLLHTDDLPYYDKGFKGMFCGKPDYNPDEKGFINYQGFKVRRSLVPSDYIQNMDLGKTKDFKDPTFIVRKDRPRASYTPPLPQNYYF